MVNDDIVRVCLSFDAQAHDQDLLRQMPRQVVTLHLSYSSIMEGGVHRRGTDTGTIRKLYVAAWGMSRTLKPNNLSREGIQDVQKVVNQLRKIIVAGNKQNKDV